MALLQGKVAFITGGARNIGLAIAERFCEEGAKVLIGDVDPGGEQAAQSLKQKGYEIAFVHLNVTDERSVEKALQITLDTFGGVDILVNNAGIHFNHALIDTDLEDWNRLISINLTGAMLCCKIFARQLIQQGRGGRILFTSSQAGKRGSSYTSAYAASKFGMIGLMESLALELAEANITVNAVCPGNVDTEMLSTLLDRKSEYLGISSKKYRQQLLEGIPLKRLATPRELADTYVFLASDMAAYISGESVVVDGGELSG